MSSRIETQNKLLEEFEAVTKELDEVLKDLEWRKPDVENEEAKLAELKIQAKKDPGVDVASQAIIVRVLRDVLDDKIQLAEALEQRMLILRDQLEALESEEAVPEGMTKRGEAIRKKKKRLG